jgi:hypothetical protein
MSPPSSESKSLYLLPVSLYFPAWLFLSPWKWRQHVTPRRQLTFNELRGDLSQKVELFITTLTTSVGISNPTRLPYKLFDSDTITRTLERTSLQMYFASRLCGKFSGLRACNDCVEEDSLGWWIGSRCVKQFLILKQARNTTIVCEHSISPDHLCVSVHAVKFQECMFVV